MVFCATDTPDAAASVQVTCALPHFPTYLPAKNGRVRPGVNGSWCTHYAFNVVLSALRITCNVAVVTGYKATPDDRHETAAWTGLS